jgi:UDPglucose 6-dehydrogenase
MIVGVIGIGVVGSAVLNTFINFKINVHSYDKYKNIGDFDIILHTDIVFLCLPTLIDDTTNKYDMSAIDEVCSRLVDYKGIVVLKSTVETCMTEKLGIKYNIKIIHNPEFLNARSSFMDFELQDHIVLGFNCTTTENENEIIKSFFRQYFPEAEMSIMSSNESETMKLFCNTFYAIKVQVFSEFYMYCSKMKLNYNTVVKSMLMNNMISPEHTDIPGEDKKLSYGGACLPKDIIATNTLFKTHGVDGALIDTCIIESNKIRDYPL